MRKLWEATAYQTSCYNIFEIPVMWSCIQRLNNTLDWETCALSLMHSWHHLWYIMLLNFEHSVYMRTKYFVLALPGLQLLMFHL